MTEYGVVKSFLHFCVDFMIENSCTLCSISVGAIIIATYLLLQLFRIFFFSPLHVADAIVFDSVFIVYSSQITLHCMTSIAYILAPKNVFEFFSSSCLPSTRYEHFCLLKDAESRMPIQLTNLYSKFRFNKLQILLRCE